MQTSFGVVALCRNQEDSLNDGDDDVVVGVVSRKFEFVAVDIDIDVTVTGAWLCFLVSRDTTSRSSEHSAVYQ